MNSCVWAIFLTGGDSKSRPIIVTAYDPVSRDIYNDSTDEKPVINGLGKTNSAFYLLSPVFRVVALPLRNNGVRELGYIIILPI